MGKINLNDVTFLFLVRLDSVERLENILASITLINNHFETNIKVLECSEYCNEILKNLLPSKIKYTFIIDDDPVLYRTKYLNQMLSETITKYVAVWDVDVIIPTNQIEKSISLLRDDLADCVYPYKSLFLDTSPIIRKLYLQNKDMNILTSNIKRMNSLYEPDPVGGAFFCKTNKYKETGGENESYYGWGIEDGDRYTNWKKKGCKIIQILGPLFHLTHPRGKNSTFRDPSEYIVKYREFIKTTVGGIK